MRVTHGEFELGPRTDDGSFKVRGVLVDAYDPAFDEGALNSVSDDERLDVLLPAHPLSRVRSGLRGIVGSLHLDEGASATAPARQDGAAAGPRRELSLPVLRGLFAAAERFDLVEQSLQEELASLGESPTPQLASVLMQLGIYQHMRDRRMRTSSLASLPRYHLIHTWSAFDGAGASSASRL